MAPLCQETQTDIYEMLTRDIYSADWQFPHSLCFLIVNEALRGNVKILQSKNTDRLQQSIYFIDILQSQNEFITCSSDKREETC